MAGLLDTLAAWNPLRWARDRVWLSMAKHPSLLGHPRIALRLSRWVPEVSYDAEGLFAGDGAPPEVQRRRREGFAKLSADLRDRAPQTLAASAALAGQLSDVDFVNHYRVPFQYERVVREALPVGLVAKSTRGALIEDLDGNWDYDLSGSYGVNLFGGELYKECVDEAVEAARELGPVTLGPYHPCIGDNVARLRALSGMDEVSFHMSGTEAVMQAVRLARYHTGRSHIVRFCGAYHGWWDGVQAGPGNPRPAREVYTLAELSERTLRVLRTRRDIACVLVNPLQALSPNGGPAADSSLISGDRRAQFDRAAYTDWLKSLRRVCDERGIALIFDEVFLGFRLAPGGAQEYFGVRADLVTYGKTLGGGLPVGALCGKHDWMRRFRPGAPADICFARGTFNSHPLVMTAMNAFLRRLERPEIQATYAELDARWDSRRTALNNTLREAGVPVRFENMVSVFTTLYTQPGRAHWLLQFYLRRAGLVPAWIGSGRFIFPHNLSDEELAEISRRLVAAAVAMRDDGWWWRDEALTDKAIKRQVSRELLDALRAKLLGRPAEARPALPDGDRVTA